MQVPTMLHVCNMSPSCELRPKYFVLFSPFLEVFYTHLLTAGQDIYHYHESLKIEQLLKLVGILIKESNG